MTEDQWLEPARQDPFWEKVGPMLEHLGDRAAGRKLRLFACACAGKVEHLMKHERSRRAVRVARAFADGRAGLPDLETARREARDAAGQDEAAVPSVGKYDYDRHAELHSAQAAAHAAQAAVDVTWVDARHSGRAAAVSAAGHAVNALCLEHFALEGGPVNVYSWVNEAPAHEETLCALLRDVFGNPFRPAPVDPAWRTPAVLAVARACYDTRDFTPIPVLADALEDAGCANPDVLAHCRTPDRPVQFSEVSDAQRGERAPVEHARGCWLVDLLLGL
jgi:hypothetical protein